MKRYQKSDTKFFSSKLYAIGNLFKQNGTNSQWSKINTCNNSDGNEGQNKNSGYWMNCDTSIWLRSCENELIEPIQGKISGVVPKWLRGTVLRNGPGTLKVGDYEFQHLFDGSALLHKFYIGDGNITYQRRFVQTDVYKKNHAAQRIVITEYGTQSMPDPCQSIFHRISSIFTSWNNVPDNSMISIYPFGDEYYTFTEFPYIHRIDTKTLETKDKVNISKYVNIINHTAHPHVMNDGTVYNVGMSISALGPAYNVVCFSPSQIISDKNGNKKKLSMFDQAKIVATVPSRWFLNPSYMHTFGITENYFIIVEQPMSLSLISSLKCYIFNSPLDSGLKWYENENTLIHVISKKTGYVEKTFVAEAFFYLHIINQFETHAGDYIVLDICCYRDAKMLDCMYIEVLKNIHKNPDYPELFRGRPLRFILPMKKPANDVPVEENLVKLYNTDNDTVKSDFKCVNENEQYTDSQENILQRKASAHRLSNGDVFVKPELLCDLGCETPRLNIESYAGKKYRYFYAISSDVDLDNPGTIIKVDTVLKTKKTWCEKNVYPSEPIFVPTPNGKNEDDGIILSAIIWGQDRETEVGLLILNAVSFIEIARVTFVTPGPVPKCLHGWFSMEK